MEFIENIDIWRLLGGLGIFLFAMFTLEDAIKRIAGRSFKRFIKQQTKGRLRSIFTGTIVTAILQSSSAVSLMVLAFVGAGIMAMENAIGVILGTNIGTTATAWIVASVGFKLNIEAFALPIIGLGGLILIFLGKSERYSNIAKLLVSFGFLFMGLSFMKESMDQMAASINLDAIPHYGLFAYLFLGIFLTAAMQSSSATIALILTGINAGLLTFDNAAVMVVGANIGTTATVLIGGIRATQIKKRVAASHLIFNLVAAVFGMALLWPLTELITLILGDINDNAVMGIALFHSIFNVLGVLIFLPFIPFFSGLLLRVFPDKKSLVTGHIHQLAPSVYDAALSGLKKEVQLLATRTMHYNLLVVGAIKTGERSLLPKVEHNTAKLYQDLKLLQSEIFRFSTEVQNSILTGEESYEVIRLMHCAREILNAAKSIKDVEHNIVDFESRDQVFLEEVNLNIKKRMQGHYKEIDGLFETEDHEEIAKNANKLIRRIKDEDIVFVKNVMSAVREGTITEALISEVLMLNREFIRSSHLILHAVLEMKLENQELNFFDNLTR